VRKLMEKIEHGIEFLHRVYGIALEKALAWRKSTMLIAFSLFIGSFFLVPFIGTEFMPEVDQGYTTLRFKMPVGSSLAYTDGKVAQVEKVLKEFKEIEIANTTIGQNNPNEAQIDLKLTDRKLTNRISQTELEGKVRDRLKAIPGVEMSVGWNRPIFISILGPEADKLQGIVDGLMYKIGKIKGITDLESSLTASNPGITVKVNSAVASDLGVSLQQIGSTLRPFIAGDTISHWLAADGQNYDVSVQLPKAGRESVADLSNLTIASTRFGADGKPIMVPLRQVVDFIPSTSPQVIKRQDLQRRVSIYANVEGRPKGDAGKEVQALLKTVELPAGYHFDVGGQSKDMDETFLAAVAALAIAVIFIYLILASQFGSYLQPIAIMVSLPFSLIGVFVALLVTGSTLNIFSIIGFIMLMGLVTKNAILLVDFTNHGQRAGLSQHDAILQAGQVRLRPILMTTLAMLFGMLPMALGLGDGGEQQAPMGRAVIGGIITSTILTLVVVPVVYTYLDTFGRWAKRRMQGGHKKHAAPDAAVAPVMASIASEPT
jgi:multidrug efflux pump subunit AcrB